MKKQRVNLMTGSPGKLMTRLTIPMAAGMFAMTAFNITDTFFVARLGTIPLAAMSFTFPVVLVISAVALSIGIGATSVISRGIGRGDSAHVTQVATDTLILAVLVVGFFSVAGILSINPLFTALGADIETLELTRQYMMIWYSSVAVLIIPMIGNFAIRATGDTKTPALIMIVVFGLNIILDPIMIFGYLGCPAMGLRGAAWATVISRAISLVASLSVLHFKYQMINFRRFGISRLWNSWKQVLAVALPTAVTQLMRPLSIGVITRIAAGYGDSLVAALGAGSRIEMFAQMIPIALATALLPLIGQNWGAGFRGRVARIRYLAHRFGIVFGLLSFGLFWVTAPYIAKLFTDDPIVSGYLVRYLKIVPLGTGMLCVSIYVSTSLNAIGKAVHSAFIGVCRSFLFTIPFALCGSWLFGITGLFAGIATAAICAGFLALFVEIEIFRRLRHEKS